ncbi:MAG: FadR/GntR family transcriptional regulator [Gulosibacter sp.]|uniref:FadR/GntR family transcriptional regulator n=1 Tax=Gulosibacter sp. TaxID=2817531 RepID=UPI003F8FB305
MTFSATSSKVEESARFLQEQITSGQWPVNTKIPREPELMELLEVGKSTVREAVRSLSAMGMLEPIKGVGTFVRSRTPVSHVVRQFMEGFDLDDLLGLRSSLEVEAAQLAARNRTDEDLQNLQRAHERDVNTLPGTVSTLERGQMPGSFHHYVFEASGNKLMASLYANVMGAIHTMIDEGRIAHGVSDAIRQRDHGALLQAITDHDVASAAHVMAMHVDRDLISAASEGPDDSRAELLRTNGAGA